MVKIIIINIIIIDCEFQFACILMYLNKTNKTRSSGSSISLPRQVLITIYKAFVRPHIDYGDVLYDQAFNNSFHAKMESIQ